MFLKTLSIGKKTVDVALRKKSHGSDQSGKQSSVIKTPSHLVALVHNHIKSFPTLESHYSRSKSKKKYLSRELNIKVMFKLLKKSTFQMKNVL